MVRAAAVYCRISRDAVGRGLGVERQEKLCRALAKEKGWPVAEVYVDNDTSAYSGKPRPNYLRMIRDLESGTRDAVVVLDQDRLVRLTRELEDFIDIADRHGIALANVSGDLDLSTSDGRFRAKIMGAVAQHESDKKSERLRRQRDQAAELGTPHGGRRAYGYKRDGMTVDAEEAANVVEALQRVLAGESLRHIARDWNARGIRPVYADGWRVTTLRTLLTSPRIVGLRRHRGVVVGDAAWSPIVEREDWEKAQLMLGDPRRRLGRPPSAPHLLSGLLACGRCGRRLYHSSRSDTGRRRYVCDQHPGSGGCGRVSVTAEPIEASVSEQTLIALTSEPVVAGLGKMRAAGPDAATATLELQVVEGERRELGEAYGRGEIPLALVLAAQPDLDRREHDARSRLAALTAGTALAELPASAEEIHSWWTDPATDDESRRRVLSAVIEEVTVLPAAVPGRRFFDPERARIRWRV